jgi:hypothetical protein
LSLDYHDKAEQKCWEGWYLTVTKVLRGMISNSNKSAEMDDI